MKRMTMLGIVILSFSRVSAWAQDAPRYDVFGGYSFVNADGNTVRETLHGWQAGVAWNLANMLGIVGDFGGHYKTVSGVKLKTFEYMGGPRVNFRTDRATAFGHALYGSIHSRGSGTSTNDFSMAYGGGVDIKANEMVDIRVVQFDWLLHKNDNFWEKKDVRLGFGVVFHPAR